jgi:hypothetical protein
VKGSVEGTQVHTQDIFKPAGKGVIELEKENAALKKDLAAVSGRCDKAFTTLGGGA